MEFDIQQSEFLKIVNIISGCIPDRTQMPILKNVLLNTSNNRLTISSTDLESVAIGTTKDVNIKENGKIVVPGKELVNLVSALPVAKVIVKVSDNKLDIKCAKVKAKLSIIGNIDDYPPTPKIKDEDMSVDVDIAEFVRAIKSVIVAVSYKIGVLSGVHIEIEGKNLVLVATDGFRLGRYIIPVKVNKKQNLNITVPIKILNEIVRLSDSVSETVKISSDNVSLSIESDKDNFTLMSQLYNQKYPDYRAFIPDIDKIFSNVVVDKEEFVRALKMCQIFGSINSEVKIEAISKDNSGKMFDYIIVNSSDKEIGEGKIDIDAEVTGFLDTVINGKYLNDMIGGVKGDKLQFICEGEKKAVFIRDQADTRFIGLVMPLMH